MIEIECHINIRKNGAIYLNHQKTSLLNEINHRGSLSSAAKQLKISYQHAWNMIDEMNSIAPQPLVIKQRGGINGGGAQLSVYGKGVIKEFNYIEAHVIALVQKLNVEITL
ncbi:winged helix-turn-helix domain-containing protein [Alkalitalea saponilacus]|uniref:Molybdate transport system regulatory protein n=1 Tax=Alkalitalea saponilacus TaxID=889453 RepID=A0A1T5GPB2_9BACT|nr:LysR family transcriptional regulator [Alkalitalea saponilacus]ASB48246.1 ModE family transcriptional regulator [Alkalitalea saponilacus]SKC10160.1 molybdate transport system regulatory protein [Alkalitalea saponilacus]